MSEADALAIRGEEPLGAHLALRCGGTIEQWVEVDDEAQLVAAIKRARAEKWTIRPIFPFQDALPPDGGLSGLGLRLGGEFERVDEQADGSLAVGAGALLAPIGLRPGFEALLRAPGTLWDAYEDGWILPAMLRMRRFRGRGFEDVDAAAAEPKALLVGAVLRPGARVQAPAAGQAFRDIRGTRKAPAMRDLLRKAQLQGLRVHGATLGEDDPAVLSNRGDATPRHLRTLLSAVRERVQTATGIQLEERLVPAGRGGRL